MINLICFVTMSLYPRDISLTAEFSSPGAAVMRGEQHLETVSNADVYSPSSKSSTQSESYKTGFKEKPTVSSTFLNYAETGAIAI